MKKVYYLIIAFLMGYSSAATAQIDYASQIQPIFNAQCVSCHGGTSGLSMSDFATLMSSVGVQYGSNLVVAGDPAASGLLDKIDGNTPDFGNIMPPGGSVSSNDVALIRQWITEGANAVPTSNEIETQRPTSFRLIGNYPNPFNPSTQIQFELSESVQYTISVFSVHGQLLMEEVGFADAGIATVSIDMQNNPTGVYLYQVSAVINGQTSMIGTGRMTLIK